MLAEMVRGVIVPERREAAAEVADKCCVADFACEWRRCLFIDLRVALRRNVTDLRSLVSFLQKQGTWRLIEEMTEGRWYGTATDKAQGPLAWLKWWLAEHAADGQCADVWVLRLKDMRKRREAVRVLTSLLVDMYRTDGDANGLIVDAIGRLSALV